MIHQIIKKVTRLDELVLVLIQPLYQFVSIKTFWKSISRTGDGWFYPLSPLIVWLCLPMDALDFFQSLLMGFGLDVPLYLLFKRLFKRPRPFQAHQFVENLARPVDAFSFPSGHTAAASLFTVILIGYFPFMFWIAVIWCAGVGLSRVFLGAHYLSDVLAGAFLGGGIGQIVLLIQ